MVYSSRNHKNIARITFFDDTNEDWGVFVFVEEEMYCNATAFSVPPRTVFEFLRLKIVHSFDLQNFNK